MSKPCPSTGHRPPSGAWAAWSATPVSLSRELAGSTPLVAVRSSHDSEQLYHSMDDSRSARISFTTYQLIDLHCMLFVTYSSSK
jgi:hypothetical protein